MARVLNKAEVVDGAGAVRDVEIEGPARLIVKDPGHVAALIRAASAALDALEPFTAPSPAAAAALADLETVVELVRNGGVMDEATVAALEPGYRVVYRGGIATVLGNWSGGRRIWLEVAGQPVTVSYARITQRAVQEADE